MIDRGLAPVGWTPLRALGILMALAGTVIGPVGCGPTATDPYDADKFPVAMHDLVPPHPRETTQIPAGAVTGEAPVQPIAFPHNRHVQKDGIDCQYCHSAARNSIHGGVPGLQTCMTCHKYVLKNSPEIKLLTTYWERGEPVPWKKVHDLPDFVNFSHTRHVQGGVDCTECHGQVQNMAGVRAAPKHGGEHAEGEAAAPEIKWEDLKDPTKTPDPSAAVAELLGPATNTVTREASLQMGWCLDCHASHKSINENYGDKADLRRAELKDCWTCHK